MRMDRLVLEDYYLDPIFQVVASAGTYVLCRCAAEDRRRSRRRQKQNPTLPGAYLSLSRSDTPQLLQLNARITRHMQTLSTVLLSLCISSAIN
jgi:hypothetical protein